MPDFSIDNLVLDAAPLLSTAASSSASALRGMARHFVTTPDVISEIRDKTSRELFATTLQMLGLDDGQGETGGLQVKEPTAEAVAKITAFAKLTGDIAVLSQADIRVLALTYALEVEKNGTRRLREAPGKLSQEEQEREAKKQERLKQTETQSQAKKPAEESPDLSKLSISPESTKQSMQPSPVASTSRASEYEAESTKDTDEISTISTHDNETESSAPTIITQEQASSTIAADSDSDEGEWITPSNVKLHQSRDLGLFPSLPASAHAGGRNKQGEKEKRKTVLKVACLTGDFAMQNVALQIGLNVFGVGGKKIRDIKTWVLRCHACFKICKDPMKKFCPSCGNPSLIRTSITYMTPTPENPQGYTLHLKPNFQYHMRGTQYSIPNPKQGSSNSLKNSGNAELILREDQKEWTRGVKSAEIVKNKQERAAAKAMQEGRGRSIFGGLSFDDPDWMPNMLSGEKGAHNGGPAGVRVGKDGLPIIGHGRRNPNQSRGKKK